MSIYSVYNTFPVRPTPVHMNSYDNIQENTVLQSVILEQGFLNYKLISFQSSVTKVLRLKSHLLGSVDPPWGLTVVLYTILSSVFYNYIP